MNRTFVQISLLCGALVLVAGSSRRVIKITERQNRIRISKSFASYSHADQQLIRSGRVRVGLDEYGVWLALGEPSFYWNTWMGRRWCRVLLYGREGGADVNTAVYTCNSVVAYVTAIQPAIPCWRLTKVSKRAMAALRYFERRPLTRQWEIVTGLIRRKQTTQDLAIMLGKPYNTGVDAREDGTNATTQVYLDSTGEAYGLHVTLIQGLVVGWKIPAARQLTPEAQQRRLRATEKRLIAKMQEIEQRSIKRHREEMSLLSRVQSNQQRMMQSLVTRARYGIARRAAGRYAGGRRTVRRGRSVVRGHKRLILNGCTYTDGPTGELGRRCGSCGPGYVCLVMSGTSGVCVPKAQSDACDRRKGYKRVRP